MSKLPFFPRLLNSILKRSSEYCVRPKELREINICDINEWSKIYSPCKITNTRIEKGTYIAINSMISYADIGKFCSIGPNFLCGYGVHPIEGVSTSPCFYSTLKQNGRSYCDKDKIEERKKIVIGNDVFIGMNACVLDGVTIGDGAVIAAGAVVVNDVEPYSVVGGIPAKHIKYRFDEDVIVRMLDIKWWNWDDKKLKYVEECFFDIDKFIKINWIYDD